MRGILAVAGRELGDTRNVWPAAAVASLVAILSPLIPGFRREAASDVRTAMALFLAGSFFAGLSVVLGASVVCRELKDRRMGFYFSKPLSAFAVWGGKFLGASLLAFGSALLVLLPTALLEFPKSLRIEKPAPLVLLAAAAVAVASFHVIHAVSLVVRSRSPLLLLDLVLAAGVAMMTAAVARNLVHEHAVGALQRGWCVFALIASAAFVTASFASVASGRIDVRAAHRALSATLWGMLLPATGLFALYGHWVLAAVPKDLVEVERIAAAPSGNWATLFGPARGRAGYRPSFLLNTANGRFRELGDFAAFDSLVFSRDGKLAVWLERDPTGQTFDLRAAHLEETSSTPFRTKLSFASEWTSLALSPDGKLIAVLETRAPARPLLSVHELASGRLLASASIPAVRNFFFVTPDRVRVYAFGELEPRVAEGSLEIFELDLRSRKIEPTGRIDSLPGRFILRAEPSGRRMLVQEFGGRGIRQIRLYDGRTGGLVAVLSSGEAVSTRRADFLSDGRIAVAEAGPPQARLRIFSADGAEQTSVLLGPGGSVALGGEVASGRIIVVVRNSRETLPFDSKIFLVDGTAGTARQVATGLFPVSAHGWWFATDPSMTLSPESDGVRLFLARGFSLVRLDPLTGVQTTVLSGKAGSSSR
jgi:hypothetical protein